MVEAGKWMGKAFEVECDVAGWVCKDSICRAWFFTGPTWAEEEAASEDTDDE